MSCWWWLRTPGFSQGTVSLVNGVGFIRYYGNPVDYDGGCVRPVLNLKSVNIKDSNLRFIDDNTLIYCGTTWKKIDDNLYIAEFSIAAHKVDSESTDYETSEIRQFLLDWYEERKDW